MTITQTIEVPDNRLITLKVPSEVPTGRTNVLIQFPVTIPQEAAQKEAKGQISSEAFRQALRRAHGAWKENPWTNHLDDVNAMRDEWEQRN